MAILNQVHETPKGSVLGPSVGDSKVAVKQEPTELTGTTQRDQRIRIKNRRKTYLDQHPSYFESPELELADPLLYDRCIRRFQSAAERELDGRSKGYSGVLEADLYRSEAKLVALQNYRNPSNSLLDSSSNQINYIRGPDGQILPEDPDEVPADKEEGLERWKYEMAMRFIKGDDVDFSYVEVDKNDKWDVIESREAEERWFDDEEPQYSGDGLPSHGDTGIQDF